MLSYKGMVWTALILIGLLLVGVFAAEVKPLAFSPSAGSETLQPQALPERSQQMVTVTALGGIKGKVQGLDLADVERTIVTAWSDSITKEPWRYKGSAVVDSNFTYQIDSLVAGRYFVNIWADGYVNKFYPNVTNQALASKVPVLEDQITDHIDFNMEKLTPGSGSISGRVVDEAGHPILMAIVYAQASGEPYFYGKAETDPDGHFIIKELKTSRYTVQVIAEGYLSEYYQDVYDVTAALRVAVTEPNESKLEEIRLSVGGSISGIVIDQKDQPILGAQVQVIWAPADTIMERPEYKREIISKTDENGRYTLRGLEPGDYYVSATVYQEWYKSYAFYPEGQDMSRAQKVRVLTDQEVDNINIRVRLQSGAGSIAGQVLDRNGHAFEGASVNLQSVYDPAYSGPYLSMSSQTDKEGKYSFARVPAGSYQISCWAQSGWQTVYRWWPDAESLDEATMVVVREDERLSAINFALPITLGRSSIHGYVQDQSGRPLRWANVQVSPVLESVGANQSFAYASTDSNGYYQVDQLTAGDYVIYASYWENTSLGQQWWDHKDSLSLADRLHLAEGETKGKVDFNLTIKPVYGAIVGTVSDAATGLPIPRAYVEIKVEKMNFNKMMRPFWYYPYYAFTDDNGQFVFEWIREGSYFISAYCNGSFAYYENAVVLDQATPVQVKGGVRTTANFAMKIRKDGMGVISGLVEQDYGVQPVDSSGRNVKPGAAAAGFQTVAANPIDRAVVIAKPAITLLQWPQSEMFYTALTEKDGSYKLAGLPAGEYFVKSFAPYHMTEYYNNVYDPSEATLVKVEGTTPTTEVNFQLSPMVYLYMKESYAGNRTDYNGAMIYGRISDESGNSLADVMIYLLDENGKAVDYTSSNADGSYQLAGMNAGNYRLQAVKMGFAATFNGNVPSSDLAQNVNLGNGAVQLDLVMSTKSTTGVEPTSPTSLPETIVLYGNFPNPFNPSTQIRFSLPKEMETKLIVYDLTGREVTRLVDGKLSAGLHTITWNGRSVSSGVYLYRLQAGANILRGKMVLMK